MDYDSLKLENQICFPLYACAREIINRYKPFLDKIGLTYTQYIAMMVLWERGQVTAKELGGFLYLDSGTLTPLLKKMESAGLVTRHRSKEDERNLIVTITEKGKALREKAVKVPEEMKACIPLSPGNAKNLYETLYGILDRVGRRSDTPKKRRKNDNPIVEDKLQLEGGNKK